MANAYSSEEIFQIAVDIEKRGVEFYNILAKNTEDEKAKELYKYLAAEEKKHITVFSNLRDSLSKKLPTSFYDYWELEDMGLYLKELANSEVFPDIDNPDIFTNKFQNEKEIIAYAMSIEKSNILFFKEVLDALEGASEEDKSVVKGLIKEEKKHILKLAILMKQ